MTESEHYVGFWQNAILWQVNRETRGIHADTSVGLSECSIMEARREGATEECRVARGKRRGSQTVCLGDANVVDFRGVRTLDQS